MITDLAIIASITFVSMMSPGPDMILIIKNCGDKRFAPVIFCIIGICCGLCIHVTLAIAGIAALIVASDIVFSAVKLTGAVYLVYLGIRSWLTKERLPEDDIECNANKRESFRNGFFCNLLNPKVTIFILAMFTQVIAPSSSFMMKLIVAGLLIGEALAVWTIFALLIRHFLPVARSDKFTLILNRTTGSLLIVFGILLAIAHS